MTFSAILMNLIRTAILRPRDDAGHSPDPEPADPFDTQAAEVALEPVPLPGAIFPDGKGMFVRSLRRHGGTPQAVIERCRHAGLSWVCCQAVWQYPDGHSRGENADIVRYASELHRAGIAVWVWGYPQPYQSTRFVELLADRARAASAVGVVIDVEEDWIGTTKAAVEDLVNAVRDELPDLPVGFTSYGAPWNFKRFPWKAFAAATDFAIPQAYDTNNNMGPGYQRKSIESYRKLGFSRIVPGLRVYNITPDEIVAVFKRTPMPEDSMIWWDWLSVSAREWNAIRSCEITRDESVS